MDKKFFVFDTFKDADEHDKALEKLRTPAERILDCYALSIQGWKLHKGKLPEPNLRNNPKIDTRELKES